MDAETLQKYIEKVQSGPDTTANSTPDGTSTEQIEEAVNSLVNGGSGRDLAAQSLGNNLTIYNADSPRYVTPYRQYPSL